MVSRCVPLCCGVPVLCVMGCGEVSSTHCSPGESCSSCGAPGGWGDAESSHLGHQPAAPSSASEPLQHSGLLGEASDGGQGLEEDQMEEGESRVK